LKEGHIPTRTVVAEVDVPVVPTAADPGASGRTNPAALAETTTDASVAAEITQGLEERTKLTADVEQALDSFGQEQVETPTAALENLTDPSVTEIEASIQDLEESSEKSMAATTRTPPAVVAQEAIPPTTPPAIPLVTNMHEVAWYADHRVSTKLPIKGDVPLRSWAVRANVGDTLGPGSDVGQHQSRLEVFSSHVPTPAAE
jgi:hypothetical protein